MERLQGGFVNDCFLQDTVVVKQYQQDGMVGQSGLLRKERERIALTRFGNGHGIAPSLVTINEGTLLQEFLKGDVLESVQKTEEDLYYSGKLLRRIHTPVSRSFETTKNYYQNRFRKHVNKAIFILNDEGINPHVDIDWDKVKEAGTTRVHRDFWLGNVMRTSEVDKPASDRYKAIDWEFSGIGSPYEDFAISDMWIFRVHGGEDAFWEGYGSTPDKATIREFLKMKAVEFTSRIGYQAYNDEGKDGFYHGKIKLLKELL